jgi:uncharacterized protein YfaT (DUF1175 family)
MKDRANTGNPQANDGMIRISKVNQHQLAQNPGQYWYKNDCWALHRVLAPVASA